MVREDNAVPRENSSNDADAALCADIGTSRAAIVDVAKHQGLASLSGFPFEVRTSGLGARAGWTLGRAVR
jgi:hypothetical protein